MSLKIKNNIKFEIFQLKKNKYFTIEKEIDNYIFGVLKIAHEKNEMKISREFHICIKLSKKGTHDFFEMDKEIPDEYHHHTTKDPFLSKFSLCLGINSDINYFLKTNKSINDFIDYFVIPYFFNFSCFEKYGKYCWEGYSHGSIGIKEYYKEKFEINDEKILYNFFKLIVEDKTFLDCPCGSNKSFKECHLKKVKFISDLQLKLDSQKIYKKSKNKRYKKNSWK